jgi:hypothetical protein
METPQALYRQVEPDTFDTIELPFYYLGLNTVPKRFFAGVGMTGALLFVTRPSALFYEDGTPRPWSLTSEEKGSTVIPWWIYSVAVGGILATFI